MLQTKHVLYHPYEKNRTNEITYICVPKVRKTIRQVTPSVFDNIVTLPRSKFRGFSHLDGQGKDEND